RSFAGTAIERAWLNGKRMAAMNSVDLFGTRRIYDNPAVNFIYIGDAAPDRDSVTGAIRNCHTIATCGFTEADITCNGAIPGSVIARQDEFTVRITAEILDENIREVRIYADDKVILCAQHDAKRIDCEYKVNAADASCFIRVEVSGCTLERIAICTPFFFD
ncbi:MAG: hypothetical protein J6S21_05265, partial [Victivallales bacterium]|nr:hypothetical protein [Victivallales bacterium]